MSETPWKNALDRAAKTADHIMRQDTDADVPTIDVREVLDALVRAVVLDAAAVCERRRGPDTKPESLRDEAAVCAAEVRHALLCREGESVCVYCVGAGCTQCRDGVVAPRRPAT